MKPSPVLLGKALAEFGVAPDRALFAGDSITDMVAGQAADVPTVGVLGHSRVGREALLVEGHRGPYSNRDLRFMPMHSRSRRWLIDRTWTLSGSILRVRW